MSKLIFLILAALVILFFYFMIYLRDYKEGESITVDELLVFVIVEFFTILWFFR